MLKHRLLSGFTLVGLFSVVSFWNSTISSTVLLLASCFFLTGALLEFFDLCKDIGVRGYPIQSIFVGILLFLSIGIPNIIGVSNHHQILSEIGLYVLFMVITLSQTFCEKDLKQGVLNFLVSSGGLFYLVWTNSFLLKIYFGCDGTIETGNLHFFYLIIVTKSADIGGYALGKLSSKFPNGNRKLVPRLSPGKSWEGLGGGLLLSSVVSCFLMQHLNLLDSLPNISVSPYLLAITLGVIFTILGLIGDLSISILKRGAKVKDSGSRIPGMGGMLDVMDSLLLVSPFYYLLLKISHL